MEEEGGVNGEGNSGGTEELNHPELVRNYPMILVSSGAQWWFEEVR